MTTAREAELRRRFERAGQSHVFAGWQQLDAAGRARLLDELDRVDLELVAQLGRQLELHGSSAGSAALEPALVFGLRRGVAEEVQAERAQRAGMELLRAGRVGFVVVAGGQASRLGFEGPKGAFPIGPVSGRTLFEIHARRLQAVARRFDVPTPWYVMTSPANEAQTRAFFEEHDHFGLPAADVFFFSQAMHPALDFEGKILMRSEGRLFLAPDGHGGCLAAMARHGVLEDARGRGIEHFSYFQVDNPLARPADPLFLGLHALAGAGMSSKVVAKRHAGEKVGVIGRIGGRMGCIEYSDLPAELREARDASGELAFRAGNIAVHALRRDFLEELTQGGLQLPWHVARKAMAVERGGRQTLVEGAKFETFVFDALGRSPASVTLEVERALEFSPVKNASGEDSPTTARADLCRLFARWVAAARLPLPPPIELDDAGVVHPVEVCPTVAEDEQDFLARQPLHPRASEKGHLYT
jgi:UDP-N-acetylglucosamine/UDP-N-acetylgalactosamine diphosphorylase